MKKLANGDMEASMGNFLRENWFWIVFAALFIWMHVSGTGCGGHRRNPKKQLPSEGNRP